MSQILIAPSSDDVAGICAIYPPGRDLSTMSCEPRHGFSELCAADQPPFVEPKSNDDTSSPKKSSKGCAATPSTPSREAALVFALIGAGLVARRRRA